jgi:hypothetical protein
MKPWNATNIVLYHFLTTLKSIRQSMAHWTTIQVKTISPFELFPYPKILPAKQTFPRQGSVLWPLLYLFFIADLPISPDTTSATFADDTAVIATDIDPAIASSKLQTKLLAIQSWLAKLRNKRFNPKRYEN